jgi:peptidoglycan L-alanyl-D-glutamate endopeptidase CwlK
MPRFSSLSEQRLLSCDERLQRLMREAIKHVDFTVICGHRGRDEQEDAFRLGRSKVRWPNSKHNRYPSVAVDVAPYPIDWQDTARFARLAGYIERIAQEMDIRIRWGGDWDMDGRTADERLVDMPHIELITE